MLLPILDLVSWGLMVLAPTILAYFHFKHIADASGKFSIGPTMVVEPQNLFGFAFQMTAWAVEKVVIVMDAPACFFDPVISLLVSGKTNWYPESLGHSAWRVLTFPFFVLPAWSYVGSGIDALIGKKRVGKGNMIFGLVMAGLLIVIAGGVRFGLSAAERQDQEFLPWFVAGFVVWAILFAVPFVAWLRQRKRLGPM